MTPQRLKFDVFGRLLIAETSADGWITYYSEHDGKRRPANIPIPTHLDVAGITQYLDDLFHESATPENPTVRLL